MTVLWSIFLFMHIHSPTGSTMYGTPLGGVGFNSREECEATGLEFVYLTDIANGLNIPRRDSKRFEVTFKCYGPDEPLPHMP